MTRRAVIVSGDLHNLGDLALLLQCAAGLRDRLGIEWIWVRQWGAVPAVVRAQLDMAGIALLPGKRPLRVARRVAGALVVIGGGQMARDNAALSSLIGVAAAMRIARLTGGRTAVLGCGVDPLRRVSHRRLWRDILAGAALVTVRDAASREAVLAIGRGAVDPIVGADLMFMPSPLHARLSGGGAGHVVIAPCVDASEGRAVSAGRLAGLAAQAADAAGVRRVCLLAQDARPALDGRIVTAIEAALRAMRPDLAIETVAGHGLDAALDACAKSSLTITNRLHPAIFSLVARRPILIVEDGTPKLAMTAERFAIERIGNNAARIAPDMLARLAGELAHGPSPTRRGALAEAATAAAATFDLLAGATGGVRQPAAARS